jgi:hypothetical protein
MKKLFFILVVIAFTACKKDQILKVENKLSFGIESYYLPFDKT